MMANDFVIGVDQALDDSGVSIVMPAVLIASFPSSTIAFFEFLAEFIPIADARFKDREREVSALLRSPETALFSLPPVGLKKKNASFGFRMTDGAIVFHFVLSNPVSQGAEYLLADLSAEKLATVVRAAQEFFPESPPTVVMEALALRGNPKCIQILPVLAVVYAAFMRALHASSGLTMDRVGHINIGTWKVAFAGRGNADKKEVKTLVVRLGADSDLSDDESDAIAIAMTISSRQQKVLEGFTVGGRILPRKQIKQ